MYEIFLLIGCIVINGRQKWKDLLESLNLLKDVVSREDIARLEEYIQGESRKMKKALSREHMISEGVSGQYADVVIEEIKRLIPKLKDKDELRGQSGYDYRELAELLWSEYRCYNDKDVYQEYENDLKKGLFVLAKAWEEPAEESVKTCLINNLKELRLISGTISVDVKDVKTDTEDIKRNVKDTGRKVEQLNRNVEKVYGTTEDMSHMMKEMHQFLLSKNGEEQMDSGQEAYKPEKKEVSLEDMAVTDALQREADEAEEILPDEITICLAAVFEEFQEDIDSLQEFIEEQNRSQNNVRLKLQCCDGEVPQDIEKSQYCYILVGNGMEQWMQETYEMAYRLYSGKEQKDECVQLHMCFKKMPADEKMQISGLKDSSIEEWENRYRKEFNRIPITFYDINRIKLDMLLHLRTKAPDVIFSTQSIIQFRNHPELEKACREREELQRQYENDVQVFNIDKSTEKKDKLEKQEKVLKDKNDQIEVTQKDIWNHLELLTGKMQNESTMDIREAEAIEDVIEYGNYSKAEETLRSREWAEEIAAVEQSMREKKEVLKQFISSQRTLISNLETKGTGDEIKTQIKEIYERIIELSKEWHIEYIVIYEFAEFLMNWRKYKEGIEVGEELKCLYEQPGAASTEERVSLFKLLGTLYYNIGKYKNGKKYYNEAFQLLKNGGSDNLALLAELYNDLIELAWKKKDYEEAENGLAINIPRLKRGAVSEPDIYEPLLSNAYNFKAIIEGRRNRLDEAVRYHLEALKIRKRLAGRSTSYNYQPLMKLTNTYNNLGFLYKKKGDYQKSEEYYMKAIRIREEYAKRNPSVFRRSLALVYNNYAFMLNERGDNEKAQEICEKAYCIRRAIVEEEPSYKIEFANTLYKYGIILTDAGEYMYPQAQKYFEEAIEIRKVLVEEDERTYGLELAEVYCQYGKLLAQMGEFPFDEEYYKEAEKNMEKAGRLCDEYSEKNKGFDTDKTAEIYYSFAILLSGRLHKYSEAEVYYNKAIQGFKYLTRQCPQVFAPKLEEAEMKLAGMRERMDEKI